MNNKCINLKQKMNRIIYCTKKKKEIKLSECSGCKFKEYKSISRKNQKIRPITSKRAKLERERWSLFTDDLTTCIICGKKKDHLHEVFPGSYRLRSMKYGCVLPLCWACHDLIHKNNIIALEWKQKCQKRLEMSYTRDEFIKMFGKNYLQK